MDSGSWSVQSKMAIPPYPGSHGWKTYNHQMSQKGGSLYYKMLLLAILLLPILLLWFILLLPILLLLLLLPIMLLLPKLLLLPNLLLLLLTYGNGFIHKPHGQLEGVFVILLNQAALNLWDHTSQPQSIHGLQRPGLLCLLHHDLYAFGKPF